VKFHRRSKFRNVKTTVGDHRFDSKAEAKRHGDLLKLQQAGEIANLRRQVPFEVIPKQPGERACFYVADFVYDLLTNGQIGGCVVEDVKGVLTRDYVMKRKLMLKEHGIRIVEVNARKQRRTRKSPAPRPVAGAGEKGRRGEG
jgi:hypothetical protein